MAGEGGVELSMVASWGAGAFLVAMGQLVLPLTSATLFVGRDTSTVWEVPASFTMGMAVLCSVRQRTG